MNDSASPLRYWTRRRYEWNDKNDADICQKFVYVCLFPNSFFNNYGKNIKFGM